MSPLLNGQKYSSRTPSSKYSGLGTCPAPEYLESVVARAFTFYATNPAQRPTKEELFPLLPPRHRPRLHPPAMSNLQTSCEWTQLVWTAIALLIRLSRLSDRLSHDFAHRHRTTQMRNYRIQGVNAGLRASGSRGVSTFRNFCHRGLWLLTPQTDFRGSVASSSGGQGADKTSSDHDVAR